jgi:inhibitor of KinA sporulation pathway (predicted exonuclease)
LVVDVEATCWEAGPPPGEQAEIIEIGWALLDVPARLVREGGSLLVRPQRSRVSAFCTALTTLTPEMVDGGVTFDAACRFLTETLESRSRTWASYGDYDRNQFARQCASFGVPYPFGEAHLNVKGLFARAHDLPLEVGMAAALRILERPLTGTHHRGGDDARNIAVILADLLNPAPADGQTRASRERAQKVEERDAKQCVPSAL